VSNPSIAQKRCSKCGELKPLDAFHKAKGNKDGFHTQCKACRAEYSAANAEYISRYGRDYRASHIEKERERSHAYYTANVEKRRDYHRTHRAANADTIREYRRAYKAANADVIREKDRAYYVAKYATNPDLYHTKWHQRRARIKDNGGSFTSQELRHMRLTQGGFCAYCQGHHPHLSIDHVVPLDQGGRHEAANIVLACPTCNSSKGNRTPDQWVNRWYWRKRDE
jgi:5-methylcytosine-specific restriction endonuclease McrA